MVIPPGFEGELDRNFIQERRRDAVGPEVVAHLEYQPVFAGNRVVEQRGIAAAIGIRHGICEEFVVAVELEMHTAGRISRSGVENVSGESSHRTEGSRWRAGMQDR